MTTIAINGSQGFLGKQICKYFENKYRIFQINRSDYLVDPKLLAQKLNGADIIINLAGSRISLFPSAKRERIIYNSRVETTKNLVNAIRCMKVKPKLFVSFSAVGIYNFDGYHDEVSNQFGDNFLSRVCIDWENASGVSDTVVATVILRSGIILSKEGGAFQLMAKPFRYGFGAVLGSGLQPFPFIHIDDFLEAIQFVIDRHLTGIINFVAPTACTNYDFSKALNSALGKRFLFYVPSVFIRMVLRKNSFLILQGQNVVPKRLSDDGFVFKYPDIHIALNNIINRKVH